MFFCIDQLAGSLSLSLTHSLAVTNKHTVCMCCMVFRCHAIYSFCAVCSQKTGWLEQMLIDFIMPVYLLCCMIEKYNRNICDTMWCNRDDISFCNYKNKQRQQAVQVVEEIDCRMNTHTDRLNYDRAYGWNYFINKQIQLIELRVTQLTCIFRFCTSKTHCLLLMQMMYDMVRS